MIDIDTTLTPKDLSDPLKEMWRLSAIKIRALEDRWDADAGAPVFTVEGKYSSRGWTEWTQGFQFGAALLQFDVTGDEEMLTLGRDRTRDRMAPHVTHFGVHDHGFNNVSTYGNLRRLMSEGKIPDNAWEREFYDMALKASGAVQARRWTDLDGDLGYVYSFNGPHSLFVDTLRTLRAMAVAHLLGHRLSGEHDESVSLLARMVRHIRATDKYIVFYGEGRDSYDEWGRTCHEAIFNLNDGQFRCPSTQQGYSAFSTWTRGQAWALTGSAELLELFNEMDDADFAETLPRAEVMAILERCARATSDHYIENTPTDGVCYWDTGAPGLANLPDHKTSPSDPFNDFEPIDSSASAIAAQGLIRLGGYLDGKGDSEAATKYRQAGLTVLRRLLEEPYLSTDESHEGLLLHSIYHRPNGWDHIPAGHTVPHGESCMWGDYHLREAALLVHRQADGQPPYRFFNGFL